MDPLHAVFARAAEDRRHGAAEIERRLISDLLAARETWTVIGLALGAGRLLEGQPAMANLRNLARLLVGRESDEVRDRLDRRWEMLTTLDERFAESAWPLIEGAETIVTISRSSAVAAVLEGAWRRGWRGRTVVYDGIPAGAGSDQANRLAGTMDRPETPADSAMASRLDAPGVRVVVGADAVSPLRLINANGTLEMLELAAERTVPVVVVADTGKDLPDEEIDEVLASGPEVVEPGSGRRLPIFEAIPADLVSSRISG